MLSSTLLLLTSAVQFPLISAEAELVKPQSHTIESFMKREGQSQGVQLPLRDFLAALHEPEVTQEAGNNIKNMTLDNLQYYPPTPYPFHPPLICTILLCLVIPRADSRGTGEQVKKSRTVKGEALENI